MKNEQWIVLTYYWCYDDMVDMTTIGPFTSEKDAYYFINNQKFKNKMDTFEVIPFKHVDDFMRENNV